MKKLYKVAVVNFIENNIYVCASSIAAASLKVEKNMPFVKVQKVLHHDKLLASADGETLYRATMTGLNNNLAIAAFSIEEAAEMAKKRGEGLRSELCKIEIHPHNKNFIA